MASTERLELSTTRLEGECSIQLSYEDSTNNVANQVKKFKKNENKFTVFYPSYTILYYNQIVKINLMPYSIYTLRIMLFLTFFVLLYTVIHGIRFLSVLADAGKKAETLGKTSDSLNKSLENYEALMASLPKPQTILAAFFLAGAIRKHYRRSGQKGRNQLRRSASEVLQKQAAYRVLRQQFKR